MLIAFTLFHVLISLVGIVSGLVVIYGLLKSKPSEGWVKTFLTFNIATSVTGFLFPIHGVTPALILGVIALLTLGVTLWARKGYQASGKWGGTYAGTMVAGTYFNVFVLIVQSFQKIPFLNALAPTQTEPPFQVVQLIALVVFIGFGVQAARKWHAVPKPPAPKASAARGGR